MKKVVDEKFYEINDFWGDLMPMMAMEEAGEFIQAVSKFERYKKLTPFPEQWDRFTKLDDVIKEMADLIIAMEALCARYDIDLDDLEHAIEEKLDRNYE